MVSGFKPTKIGVIDVSSNLSLFPKCDNPEPNFLRVDVGTYKGHSVIMSGDQNSTVYMWNSSNLEVVEKMRVYEKNAQVFCVKQHSDHYFVYLNAVQAAVG